MLSSFFAVRLLRDAAILAAAVLRVLPAREALREGSDLTVLRVRQVLPEPPEPPVLPALRE